MNTIAGQPKKVGCKEVVMIPRWPLPILLFFLLVGGACSLWLETVPARGVGQTFTGSRRAEALGKNERAATGGEAARAPIAIVEEGSVGNVPPVASKSWGTMHRGAAAVLAEEIELRALGEARALSLTAEQWTAFAGLTLCHQAIRHAYEAEVAVVAEAGNGWQRMEIPVYAEAGAALRTEFYSALLSELGDLIAEEIVRKLSPELESRFAGFGAAAQTLEFSERASGGADGGSVTRTTVYWDEAVGGDALRTRQETFFPLMEDPDGLQWGPLLARLEKSPGKKARG
jgi:hypothetical protein